MKKLLIAAVLVCFAGVQAQAAAVGSRGGKRSHARMIDSSGGPIMFNDDKPWKVFESTQPNVLQLVDENGVAPTRGMVNRVCIGTAPATGWAVLYDSNTISGLTPTFNGVRLIPSIVGSTTLSQCFTYNALFTSGVVVDSNITVTGTGSGIYVYWRELGGYR